MCNYFFLNFSSKLSDMSFVGRVKYDFNTQQCKRCVVVESNDTTLPPDDFEEDIFHPPSADGLWRYWLQLVFTQ